MRSALLIVVLALMIVPAAAGKSSETQKAKKTYYHADGYIKAIGKNARRTIYNPDARVRHRWQRDLRYLIKIRRRAWQKLHPPDWLDGAFQCIHRYEGAWNANTGNGYYGGLQMDLPFQSRYGSDFLRRWGTADGWPMWAQIVAAKRAYHSGRGFGPWPNTARACGLL